MPHSYYRWFYVDEERFHYMYDRENLTLGFDLSDNSIPIEVYVNEIARIIAHRPHNRWSTWYTDNSDEIRWMVYRRFVNTPETITPTLYHRENGIVAPGADDNVLIDEFDFSDEPSFSSDLNN